jgi:hypothetical protein
LVRLKLPAMAISGVIDLDLADGWRLAAWGDRRMSAR